MDFTSSWIMEACDFFNDYIASESNDFMMLIKFIKYLEFPGTSELKYVNKSAVNLVLLNGDENETYSKEELSFLKSATCIIVISNRIENSELNFFQVELECSEEVKDLVACALIKILNKSFKTKNIFIFKCFSSIAIGCKFEGGEKIIDDFCITKWYSKDNAEEVLEISFEFCNANNIDLALANYSDEIMRRSQLTYEKDYDYNYFNYDYIQALMEIEVAYGIDMEPKIYKYINKYYDEYHIHPKDNYLTSYRQLSDALKFIVSEGISSYEYLELAQEAEEETKKEVLYSPNNHERLSIDEFGDLKEEAFQNAEEMLKYL